VLCTYQSSSSSALVLRNLHSFPTRRSSDLDKEFAKLEASKLHPAIKAAETVAVIPIRGMSIDRFTEAMGPYLGRHFVAKPTHGRSEEHTSELQSHLNLVCRLLLEKKKSNKT